ncbi:hypothetical protein CGRA01v4_09706 [Colletotrichum graminicola]|nr:hypothetical protein CGRA01v4_09706 [Colletotrichum graminicola]
MFPTRVVRDLQDPHTLDACCLRRGGGSYSLPASQPHIASGFPLSTTPFACSATPLASLRSLKGIGQDVNLAETPSDLPSSRTRAAVTTEIETNLEPISNARSNKALLVGTSHLQLSSTHGPPPPLTASFVASSFPHVSGDLKDWVVLDRADASSSKAPDEPVPSPTA